MAEFAAMAALSAAGTALTMNHANRSASNQMQGANEAAAQRAREIGLAHDIEERRRKEQLRREQASKLAAFGGHGLAADGGSAEAVLGGLQAQSAHRGAEAADQKSLALSGSLLDLAARNRTALLGAAQAREQALLRFGQETAAAGFKEFRGPAGGRRPLS